MWGVVVANNKEKIGKQQNALTEIHFRIKYFPFREKHTHTQTY